MIENMKILKIRYFLLHLISIAQCFWMPGMCFTMKGLPWHFARNKVQLYLLLLVQQSTICRTEPCVQNVANIVGILLTMFCLISPVPLYKAFCLSFLWFPIIAHLYSCGTTRYYIVQILTSDFASFLFISNIRNVNIIKIIT